MTRILLTLSLICLIMTGCSNSNEPIEFEDETFKPLIWLSTKRWFIKQATGIGAVPLPQVSSKGVVSKARLATLKLTKPNQNLSGLA